MSRSARLGISLSLLVVSSACGGNSNADATTQGREPVSQRSPLVDSLRARRNAALAKRPDTLGMRADSARVLGNASAKVWVIVTSDFQCAQCRDFAVNVLPLLRQEFVDTGLVRIAFVNSPQERNFNARFAAHAALCAAAAGRFWEMHDSLFATQQLWARLTDPRPYMDSLAVAAGVPAEKQADCTARNRMLLRLSSDIEQSRTSGATDVPIVFVGDRRLQRDDLTPSGLRRAILAALDKEQ
ncbi:MAG: thioredoxin domain-containing protein [Gemmatimonadaceae bacterium]